MVTLPVAFGVFGYGTAALAYGLHLATGFPKASSAVMERKTKAAMAAIGFCYGGLAQFITGLLLFVFFDDIVGATTFAIFGVLWTATWLIEYFDMDSRTLTFLDIAIAIWTILAGSWNAMLGHPVVAALMWSITALVVTLCWLHSKGKGSKVAGIIAIENAILCYYIVAAIVFTELGHPLPF